MKYLITILFILSFSNCEAQTTIPCYTVCLDTTHYWNYYNKSGSLAWGSVKGYDGSLIPKGGKAVAGDLVSHSTFTDEGFKIVTVNADSSVSIKYLDKNKQPLDKKYISAWPFDIPKNGF